jgi:hypothetical protein
MPEWHITKSGHESTMRAKLHFLETAGREHAEACGGLICQPLSHSHGVLAREPVCTQVLAHSHGGLVRLGAYSHKVCWPTQALVCKPVPYCLQAVTHSCSWHHYHFLE